MQDELFALEQGFWNGGADYYDAHVDSECLMVFPELSGVKVAGELLTPDIAAEPHAGATLLARKLDDPPQTARQPSGDDDPVVALIRTACTQPGSGHPSRGGGWRDVTLDRKGFIQLGDDVAFLSYEASATRGDGEPYRALVSTGYVRREDGWKMAFHGQTPLDAAA